MIAFLSWLFAVELIGLGALPIAVRLFRFLPDRGFLFAKPLGMLMVGYLVWVLTVFGMLRFQQGTILMLMLAMSLAAWLSWGRLTLKELADGRAAALAGQALFLVAFAGASLVRALNPEIAGTEKPMDMAFLHAIQRSEVFPPEDPWMSGHAISYYYFGYLLMAMVAKLAGVPASVAYNLAVALVFALLLAGSFSLVYNLITALRPDWRAAGRLMGAMLGPVLVGLMGNLVIGFELLNAMGLGDEAFWSAVGIRGLQATAEPTGWPPSSHWWWWRASRVIPNTPPDGINEFPYFSFLLGDLHPHFIVLPWTLLVVAISMAAIHRRGRALGRADGWLWVLVPALALGFLIVGNSWDFPTYAALFWVASLLAFFPAKWDRVAVAGILRGQVPRLLAVTALALLLYLPFMVGFGSQVRGIGIPADRTPLLSMLIIFGPFLFVLVSFFLWQWRLSAGGVWPPVAALRWAGALLLVAAWWLGALALIAGAVLLALSVLATALGGHGGRPGSGSLPPGASIRLGPSDAGETATVARRFLLLLAVLGLLLVLAPELVFVVDSFGTRMNTVFKLHYQAWVLLGLASAASLAWMLGAMRFTAARLAVALGAALIIGTGLLYPLAATPSKTQGLRSSLTLDGAAYYQTLRPDDFAAITWLSKEATGRPVVLEATGGQYSEYGRVSVFSGLPTVLGWAGHEMQWRGSGEEPRRRALDIDAMYQGAGDAELMVLLERYRVRYVFVGSLEIERYGPAVSSRFEGLLEPVYRRGEVSIYLVPPQGARSTYAGGAQPGV
jgi:YYY domain-containing protein